ncbi:hypothetical protein BEWA_000430 [Theileria equi strain WA]|uniref:Signal peptide-containing protein n=1 Tax=Theileria equi strain WA TaxID=1537102 RepID=L0AZE2_THEEQ|nr:hypothetical protein BEWA_000430 [Theileria equi strain WA]AFZ80638.1 hypothetical protein BEWA_000430 [Theileria equi strain WA]|eukprot:XP_004830304.1 hypothetical protein BEWA_000430 [Theileria equi strain WA]
MLHHIMHVLIFLLTVSSFCIDIALNLSDVYYYESQHIRIKKEECGAFKSYTHRAVTSESFGTRDQITYAGAVQEGLPEAYNDAKVYYFKHDMENNLPLLLVLGINRNLFFFKPTSIFIDGTEYEKSSQEGATSDGKEPSYLDYKDTNVDYGNVSILPSDSGKGRRPLDPDTRPKLYSHQSDSASRHLEEFKRRINASLLESLEPETLLHSHMWVRDESINSRNVMDKLARIACNVPGYPVVVDISAFSDYSIDGNPVGDIPWTVHVKRKTENGFEIYTHSMDGFLILSHIKCGDQILQVNGCSYYTKIEVHYPAEEFTEQTADHGLHVGRHCLPSIINFIRGVNPLYYVRIEDSLVQFKASERARLSSTVLSRLILDAQNYGVELFPKCSEAMEETCVRVSRIFKFDFGKYLKIGPYIVRTYDPETLEGAGAELTLIKNIYTPGMSQIRLFLKNGKKEMLSMKYDGKEYCYDKYSEYISENPLSGENILEILGSIAKFGKILPKKLSIPITKSRGIVFDVTRYKSYSSEITGNHVVTSTRYYGMFKIIVHKPEVVPFTVQGVQANAGIIKTLRFMREFECTHFEVFCTDEAQFVSIKCEERVYCMLKGALRWVIFRTNEISDAEASRMIRENSHGSAGVEPPDSPIRDDVFSTVTIKSAEYIKGERDPRIEERKATPWARPKGSDESGKDSAEISRGSEELYFRFSPDSVKKITLEDDSSEAKTPEQKQSTEAEVEEEGEEEDDKQIKDKTQ